MRLESYREDPSRCSAVRFVEALKARLVEVFADGRAAEAIDQVMLAMADLERANGRLAWQAFEPFTGRAPGPRLTWRSLLGQ